MENRRSHPSEKRKSLLLPLFAGAAALLLLMAGGLFWFLNRGAAAVDFAGWALQDARLWAGNSGVNLRVAERYDEQFAAGKVISQDIAPGKWVKKGGFICLTVSLGHDPKATLPLPDLMSMDREQVNAWILANRMSGVSLSAEYNDDISAGHVLRFELTDGAIAQMVRRDSPLHVVISKGPRDPSASLVELPNFRDMTLADSQMFAQKNAIELYVTEQYDDYAPAGTILSQSVDTRQKVKAGEKITLVVSKGKKIVVPDFSGMSREEAQSTASEAGIPITVTHMYSKTAEGEFLSQNLPAGSEYAAGKVVVLSYSLGSKIVIGSHVGQSQAAVAAWAKELSAKGATITLKVTATHSNAPKGQVIHQEPINTTVSYRSTIRITVSQGQMVFVPDFVAPEGSGYDKVITRDEALVLCEESGLVPVFVAKATKDRLPGEVYAQSIKAGREVLSGSSITLTYQPADKQTTVPDFTGLTIAQVEELGHHLLLSITFTTSEEYVDGFAAKVIAQSVAPETSVANGSTIVLTIGANPPAAAAPTSTAAPQMHIRSKI